MNKKNTTLFFFSFLFFWGGGSLAWETSSPVKNDRTVQKYNKLWTSNGKPWRDAAAVARHSIAFMCVGVIKNGPSSSFYLENGKTDEKWKAYCFASPSEEKMDSHDAEEELMCN